MNDMGEQVPKAQGWPLILPCEPSVELIPHKEQGQLMAVSRLVQALWVATRGLG